MHGYVEVTIAAALLLDDNTLLHGDMADVTLAFGLPTRQPGRELTEAESKETLRLNLGRIAAVIETGLLANGAEHMGQIEEPMTEHSHEVGYTRSDPVTVRVEFRGEARA
jgi:hypothetical protein